MEVNLTLVVQAINFFIAYIMIRKLLLVPVVAIIVKQEAHRELVQTTIAQLEESIDKAKRSRAQLWAKMKDYFVQKSPRVAAQDLHVFKGITPEINTVEIDEQEKQLLAQDVSKKLTSLVLDK